MPNKKVILFALLLFILSPVGHSSFASNPAENKSEDFSGISNPNSEALISEKTSSNKIELSEIVEFENESLERIRFHGLDTVAYPHFEKVYSELPLHNRIVFHLSVKSKENIIQSRDKLHLLFDSVEPGKVEYLDYHNNDDSNEYQQSYEIKGIVNHNTSSLKVQLIAELQHRIKHIISGSLKMNFILEPTSTNKLPKSLDSQAKIVSESFTLLQEQAHSKRILQSTLCDITCQTCDGTSPNDCTSCPTERYLTILGPTVLYCAPDNYANFGDFCEYMLLAPPATAEKATLTVLINIMQYIKYLNLPTMPANMERIAVGKGRSILSLRYGFHMPSKMQEGFIKYPLNDIFERRSLHSSFLVNFWQEIMSFVIIIAAALVFTVGEKIAKRYKWGKFQAGFEALRVITRWNLCLIILATSFGDMILFASLEFRTFYISFGPSSTYASFFVCLISIAFMTGLFAGTIYLVRKAHAARKVSYDNYILFAKHWQDFQVLFSGYSNRHLMTRMFFLVYTIRLGLPMLVAAYVYPSPLAQAILQLLISIASVAIILYYKPIRRKINRIQLILYETIVLITNIMTLALTAISIYDNENTNALNGFGYFIIAISVLINLLLLIFLLIKVVIAVKAVLALKNMHSTEEKIIAWLHILYLPLQQGGMTFESVHQELDLVNEPIEETQVSSSRKIRSPKRTTHNTSYDRNNRSVDNSMMTLFDKKKNQRGRYGNQISPRTKNGASNLTSSSNRGGKPSSPSRGNKPTLKKNDGAYRISNDLQENNLTISPRQSPSNKNGIVWGGERNGMSYNEWVVARSDPKYKKPASPVANRSNITRTPSPGNTRNQTPKPGSPSQTKKENVRQESPKSPTRAYKNSKSPNKVIPWK